MANKTSTTRAKSHKSKSARASTSDKNSLRKSRAFITLNRWNIAIAIIYAAQAIVLFFISKSVPLPIVSHYLAPDTLASQGVGHTVYALAVRHLFDIDLASMVAGFLLVSAVFHGFIATKIRNHYEADLERGVNGLRWLDYGISASLMMVTIAILNGIYDISTLIAIILLLFLLHMLGYFGEIHAVTMKAKWQSFIGLLAAGGGVWAAIGANLKGAVIYGNGLPHAIYWIDGIIFAITIGLAANTLMIFRAKDRWADYLYGERIYMALSFIAKTMLAWLIFMGFLR
jgi:hypothetical protein